MTGLELVRDLLAQCNSVGNKYQQKTEVLYIYTTNKSYSYLPNVAPSSLVF